MSFEAINWAFSFKMKSGPKFVLVALADYADEECSCYPEIVKLHAKTGIAERTIKEHLFTLEKYGLIERERQRYADGNLGSYRYTLDLRVGGEDIQGTELEVSKSKKRGKSFAKKEPGANLAPDVDHVQNHVKSGAKSRNITVQNLHDNVSSNNHQKEPPCEKDAFEGVWRQFNARLLKSRRGNKAKAAKLFLREAKEHGAESVVFGLNGYYTDPHNTKDNYAFAAAFTSCLSRKLYEGYMPDSGGSIDTRQTARQKYLAEQDARMRALEPKQQLRRG